MLGPVLFIIYINDLPDKLQNIYARYLQMIVKSGVKSTEVFKTRQIKILF